MSLKIAVYLEIGSKRTFAGAIDWPGWCRSERNEPEALAALVAYGQRYANVVGQALVGFQAPADPSALEVVERLHGNPATDFGAPCIAPSADNSPLEVTEAEPFVGLLQAAWAAFDAVAKAAVGLELRKGPRGGGRDLDKIVSHVLEGEAAYHAELGGIRQRTHAQEAAAAKVEMAAVREAAVRMLRSRVRGEAPVLNPRRKRPLWSPRYFIRRSAWHALDHAWEIEDRAGDSPRG